MSFMSKVALPAAAALFVVAGAAGAVTVPGTANTGQNLPAGDGQIDPNYTVLSSSSGAYATGTNARTYYNTAYLPESNDARWVNATGDGNGISGETTVFRTTFSLAGYDAATATLTGQFGVDDAGTVALNGVIISTYGGFNTLQGFLSNSGFLAGLNTLDFSVTNGAGPTSFIVSGLTVTANETAAAVPEPATWGMMILGFGMVGAGMRRRKSTLVAA
jgi:hypothetical protein